MHNLFVMILLINIALATVDGFFVPGWFYVTYQYWKDGLVSTGEFSDGISYLEHLGILKIGDFDQDPVSDFLITYSLIKQEEFGHVGFSDCSTGWYVTGYYTPAEEDYHGRYISIPVDGTSYKFRQDFVEDVKIEGWGKTSSGRYLGWYENGFHFGDVPLDSSGNPLVLGTVAIDKTLIDQNARIVIPTLPRPWDSFIFAGSDVGQAILGKHVDVYTGEGTEALNEAYRITSHNNVVCRYKQ